MEDAPKTREHNHNAVEAQHAMKEEKEALKKKKGFENASDLYIEALIYHTMGDSKACRHTVGDGSRNLKKLNYIKDKLQALKDNIQIRYKICGWEEWKTARYCIGVQYTVQELAKTLKEFIAAEKKRKRSVPNKPPATAPQRTVTPVLGTATSQC